MTYIFLIKEIICRNTKSKTSFIGPCHGYSPVHIFKTNLQETKIFTYLSFKADIGIVVSGIETIYIKISKSFNIPFFIFCLVPVFTMHEKIVQRTLARIIGSIHGLKT